MSERDGLFSVLICGGRDYYDRDWMRHFMDALYEKRPIFEVIHGGAQGADQIGGEWARMRRIPVRVFPADWRGLGRKAGPIRNQQMLDEGKPHCVVAFPGGIGTASMVSLARKAGVRVLLAGDGKDVPTLKVGV